MSEAAIRRDYSQSGEQATILGLVADLPVGRFLDIGAGDGETFSNTRALALAGWGGVSVEPAAWAFDKLINLYADDGAVSCVCACVTGEREGLQTFMYSRDDHLSTTVQAEADKWPTVEFKRVLVASVPLGDLLGDIGGFSVVSIDAEGRTLELVEAYMRHPVWRDVRVLCYEREPRERARLRPRLIRAGMRLVAQTPNNLIWRR